jgi:hypothetical protein
MMTKTRRVPAQNSQHDAGTACRREAEHNRAPPPACHPAKPAALPSHGGPKTGRASPPGNAPIRFRPKTLHRRFSQASSQPDQTVFQPPFDTPALPSGDTARGIAGGQSLPTGEPGARHRGGQSDLMPNLPTAKVSGGASPASVRATRLWQLRPGRGLRGQVPDPLIRPRRTARPRSQW